MKKEYRVTESGLDVLNVVACERYGLIEEYAIAEPEKTNSQRETDLMNCIAFMAIGFASLVTNFKSSDSPWDQQIAELVKHASLVVSVGNWLAEQDAINCVWAYDFDEHIGFEFAKHLEKNEKSPFPVHAVMYDRLAELEENLDISGDWIECPALAGEVERRRKNTIKTVEYTLPSFLASALINSDWTGLEDDESVYLMEWLESKVLEHGGLFNTLDCEEYGYCKENDYNNLGSDCHKFRFRINQE